MKKKTYFVTSDIHSYFTLFYNELKKQGFNEKNKNHILIICGDLFDRGNEPQEIINFILSLPKERCILIRGNHEDLFLDMVKRNYPLVSDISNRTFDTLEHLCGKVKYDNLKASENKLNESRIYEVIDRMVDYAEIGDYIFVHGWIPTNRTYDYTTHREIFEYNPDWRNAHYKDWCNARWLNGMKMNLLGINEPGKTIVCGHWHASYGNVRKKYDNKTTSEYYFLEFNSGLDAFKIYENPGIIALDACTAFTDRVNILKLVI